MPGAYKIFSGRVQEEEISKKFSPHSFQGSSRIREESSWFLRGSSQIHEEIAIKHKKYTKNLGSRGDAMW
jgi:hypothetical protein